MFTTISWQQYLQTLLTASIIYYLVVLMLYFRRDLQYWVSNFPSRRSRLEKFITGRTQKDASDVINDTDGNESIDGINSAPEAEGDLTTKM